MTDIRQQRIYHGWIMLDESHIIVVDQTSREPKTQTIGPDSVLNRVRAVDYFEEDISLNVVGLEETPLGIRVYTECTPITPNTAQ